MTKIIDPYGTQGGIPRRRRGQRQPPLGAATEDTDRRMSSWLKTKRSESPGYPACNTCKGTGSSGWKNAKGETITCESCHGWGYN